MLKKLQNVSDIVDEILILLDDTPNILNKTTDMAIIIAIVTNKFLTDIAPKIEQLAEIEANKLMLLMVLMSNLKYLGGDKTLMISSVADNVLKKIYDKL